MSLTDVRDVYGMDHRGSPIHASLHHGLIRAVEALPKGWPVPHQTLLPGLHDHHVHVYSTQARTRSVDVSGCQNLRELTTLLRGVPGTDAIRAVGYDDTLLGGIARDLLDEISPLRPIRLQHRGGHLWVLNSPACAQLSPGTDLPSDGRFWDRDDDISLPLAETDVSPVVDHLVSRGVTRIDDLTPTLRGQDSAHLREIIGPRLRVGVFGAAPGTIAADGVKIVISDHTPPSSDDLRHSIELARPFSVALHCVSVESLALVASVIESLRPDDRIEHAFVTPPGLAEAIARGSDGALRVGIHPGFLRTHGDRHARVGPADDVTDYLRVRTWLDAGATLLGGTDSPFSLSDPWSAMQAAVDRKGAGGALLGGNEALSPEEAFTLFRTGGLDHRGPRLDLHVDDAADICVIEGTWFSARNALDSVNVLRTVRRGRETYARAYVAPR